MPAPAGNAWGYSYIDLWAFDASYLKLKNISLRYDLKKCIETCSIFPSNGFVFVVTNALVDKVLIR